MVAVYNLRSYELTLYADGVATTAACHRQVANEQQKPYHMAQ
jgi:hypothetical protein